ncbi:MAG: protein-methionine-sulfoxide reductase heme-binding subunit MsrQ [Aquisalimonadaceae bacterium]
MSAVAASAVRWKPLTGRGLLAAKAAVFLLCLAPAVWIVLGLFDGRAGPNPVEYLTHETGQWGLRLLLITLAMTPLRRLTGWTAPIRFRRMLGLFAFFYVCLHFLVFSVFDHSLSLAGIVEDVVERPYILAGFVALLLLIPLAVTSTNGMMKRLGRRWKTLHRLIYLIAGLAVLHFLLQVKAGFGEPLIYTVLLLLLLSFRLPVPTRRRR